MTVEDVDGNARITMTFDELGILRYALSEGVAKLRSAAIFAASMKYAEHETAKDTADQAEVAAEELERAVQEWCRT